MRHATSLPRHDTSLTRTAAAPLQVLLCDVGARRRALLAAAPLATTGAKLPVAGPLADGVPVRPDIAALRQANQKPLFHLQASPSGHKCPTPMATKQMNNEHELQRFKHQLPL